MTTYREYQPTEFDSRGLALDDRQDWLVLIGRNRDSDLLSQSNFETALESLGGESDDVEVHRFGHWGCGWLEIIIVRPDTDAAKIADEIDSALADYPVLDESDYSSREHESYQDSWCQWGAREFRREIMRKLGGSFEDDEAEESFEDSLDAVDDGALQEFFESCVLSGDYCEDGAPVIRRAMHDINIDSVRSFLASVAPAGQAIDN